MNSETRGICEDYAKEAGAIIPCPVCGNYELSAGDTEAETRAFAMEGGNAVNSAWIVAKKSWA